MFSNTVPVQRPEPKAKQQSSEVYSSVSFSLGMSDNVVKLLNTSNSMSLSSPPSKSSASRIEPSVDQKLVQRVQKGDKAAFDMLVVKYQNKVAAVVSRYVRDSHEVADVTQEAFIKAYRAISSFRGDSAFYTWIYRIAINCAKNYLQARGRRPTSMNVELENAEFVSGSGGLKDNATPESILGRDQLEQVIKQAISNLPEDLRLALTLREFDNLSYDEIAEIMECPVGTVRSRIFRAREAIDIQINAMRG